MAQISVNNLTFYYDGSFDATKYRNCPYCEQEYNAGRDDWEVLEIHS